MKNKSSGVLATKRIGLNGENTLTDDGKGAPAKEGAPEIHALSRPNFVQKMYDGLPWSAENHIRSLLRTAQADRRISAKSVVRSRFSKLGMVVGVIREIVLNKHFTREPEPDLVMDGEEEVAAFKQAGRVDGIMSANYIHQTARISQAIQGCRRVLDLGCGPATQLAQVASFHPDTQFIGVELSDEMIHEARAHVAQLKLKNVEIIKQDMTDLQAIPDHSVDGVISTLALHHLPTRGHLEKTFCEIRRVLIDGGAIYLTDFGRLKSLLTARFMAYRDADIQPELFSRDYERSLRAAFLKADFVELARKHLPMTVNVKSTFLVPMLVVIKTADRPVPRDTVAQIQKVAQALPARFKGTLLEMRVFFRLGGMGPDLFGKMFRAPKKFNAPSQPSLQSPRREGFVASIG